MGIFATGLEVGDEFGRCEQVGGGKRVLRLGEYRAKQDTVGAPERFGQGFLKDLSPTRIGARLEEVMDSKNMTFVVLLDLSKTV